MSSLIHVKEICDAAPERSKDSDYEKLKVHYPPLSDHMFGCFVSWLLGALIKAQCEADKR